MIDKEDYKNINYEKILEKDIYGLYDKYSMSAYYDNLIMQGNKKRTELENQSLLAFMGEIVVSTEERPIVGTTGLATCNGILFYDKKNKKAWVGHGPASQSLNTLITMFNIIIKEVIGDLEYAIIPGWDNVRNHNLKEFDEMLSFLNSNCPKHIKLIPMTDLQIRQDNSDNPSYEFAFNAETGKSVTYELFFDEEYISSKKM